MAVSVDWGSLFRGGSRNKSLGSIVGPLNVRKRGNSFSKSGSCYRLQIAGLWLHVITRTLKKRDPQFIETAMSVSWVRLRKEIPQKAKGASKRLAAEITCNSHARSILLALLYTLT